MVAASKATRSPLSDEILLNQVHDAINAADALTEYKAVLKQLNVRPPALAMVNFDDGALVDPCRWRCSGRRMAQSHVYL